MIYERTLSNGLELVVCPTSAPVASVQVWVDVGSLDEQPGEAGYCHFLEHMLFKGTKHRSTAQIAGAIEGAGGEMNAFTSFEYTAYHITLSQDQWKLANDILADMVLGSLFIPSEFHPEKEVILEEIKRGEDSPDRQLYQGLYRKIWGVKDYGRPVIGFPKTVSACTPATLKSFWKKWYSPSLMTVVICGNVDVAAVQSHVEKTWGKAKSPALRKRRRECEYSTRMMNGKDLRDLREFPLNSIRWAGGFPAVNLRDPLLPALDVAASILGQGESSRLHNRLFREEQLVTSISSGVWAPAGKGLFSIDVEASVEQSGAFRKVLFQEIDRLACDGPTSEELNRVKGAMESDRIYGSQSMESLAHRLAVQKVTLGNANHDLEYTAQIKEVESEDVKNALSRYWFSENLVEYGLVPRGFSQAQFWGSTERLKKAPKSTKINKADGELVRLSNGVEIVLFSRPELPLVSMQACALGGLRAETTSNNGIGALTASVWDKGTVKLSGDKYSHFLESRASRIASFSGRNSLGLSSTMLTNHVDEITDLFIDTYFQPAYLQEDFERAKKVQLEDIRTLEDSSGRFVEKLFCQELFGNHPYGLSLSGTVEAVEKIELRDIKNHYKNLALDGRIVVSVAGKFNADALLKKWESVSVARNQKSQIKIEKPNFPLKSKCVEEKKGREQSHLILGFKGIEISDVDRYSLKVLNTFMGGQSGRLFRELRDKQGLCYVVAPLFFEGIEPGYVGVYMGCDPKKVDQALNGIRFELNRLMQKPLMASELKRAKNFLLGRHHLDLQMNSTIASASALNVLYGLDYDEHLKYSERLKSVTVNSIQKLTKRLFSSPEVVAIVR